MIFKRQYLKLMIKYKISTCAIASFAMVSAIQAQSFSGTFAEVDSLPFADITSQFTASNFTIDGAVSSVWDGATMYCLDFDALSLSQKPGWTGSGTFSGNLVEVADIQAWARYTGDGQDVAIATAEIYYAIDTYYQGVLDNPVTVNKRAFALTLWELVYDGGGSNQGINLFDDNFDRGFSFSAGEVLANTWLQEIDAANVQSTYQSKSTFLILDDLDNEDQDYIMVSQYSVGIVPEPTSSLLLGVGGLALMFKRKRG